MTDEDLPFKLENTFQTFWRGKGVRGFDQWCPLDDTIIVLQFAQTVVAASCRVRFQNYHVEFIIPFNEKPKGNDEKEFANIVISHLNRLRQERNALLKWGFKSFHGNLASYQLQFPDQRFKLEIKRSDEGKQIYGVLMKNDSKISYLYASSSFIDVIKTYLKKKYDHDFRILNNNSNDGYLYLPNQLRDLIIDGNV